MSYATNIAKGAQEVNFLIKMAPRTEFITDDDDWTLVSGKTYAYYTDSFTQGRPKNIYLLENPVNILETTKALERDSVADFVDNNSTPEWHYDDETGRLTIGGSNTSSTAFKPNTGYPGGIYIEYELYLSTNGVGWYRNPKDTTSKEKLWRGDLIKIPRYEASTNEVFFGFLPTFSSSFSIKNETGFYNTYIYDNATATGSSVSRAPVDIWRCVGPFDPANIQLAFRGFIQSYSTDENTINFSLKDYTSTFDREYLGLVPYQNTGALNNRHGSTFGDQSIWGTVRRKVHGYCEKLTGRCNYVLFETDSPDTNDNRTWIFGEMAIYRDDGSSSNLNKSATIDTASGGNVTLNSGQTTNGLSVGDEISLTNTTASTNTRAYVTDVTGALTFTHDGSFTVTSGQTATVSRALICGLGVTREGVEYRAFLNSTNLNLSVASSTIQLFFKPALETSLGLPSALNPATDKVWIRVKAGYDRFNSLEFPPSDGIAGTGSPLGSVSSDFQAETNPIQTLYELLFSLGYTSDDDYNQSSWTTVASANEYDIAFVSPKEWGRQRAESYREIIERLCLSALVKLYLNSEGKWELAKIGPLGEPDITIYSSEISGYKYRVSYDDITTSYAVKYNRKDINQLFEEDTETFSVETENDSSAVNKHGIENNETTETCLVDETQTEDWLARYKSILGAPFGVLSVTLPLSKINMNLGDVVRVYFDNIIGETFGSDTYRDFSVIRISYDLDEVEVELFDQLGIEANAAEWS